MNAEDPRKNKIVRLIHFTTISILLLTIFISVIFKIYFEEIDQQENAKIAYIIGSMAETPMLLLMILYMYRYFKLKKEKK